MDALARLREEIVACRRCPRLVAWREHVARHPRPAYAGESYWARPVPGFGEADARIVFVGLAPAAHGANRTGRVFTGDRAGDWLYAALHRAGLASRPTARARDDGLELRGAYILAPVRCAPPENRPTRAERDTCLPFLERELALLTQVTVVVAMGVFAHEAVLDALRVRPRPRFAHGAEHALPGGRMLLDSYHPSQRNTFTGKLTEEMFDRVCQRARWLAVRGPWPVVRG
ncbi:MAG: uracil-DNA glycosylase family protein [Dehalococcoidia bacterium]